MKINFQGDLTIKPAETEATLLQICAYPEAYPRSEPAASMGNVVTAASVLNVMSVSVCVLLLLVCCLAAALCRRRRQHAKKPLEDDGNSGLVKGACVYTTEAIFNRNSDNVTPKIIFSTNKKALIGST